MSELEQGSSSQKAHSSANGLRQGFYRKYLSVDFEPSISCRSTLAQTWPSLKSTAPCPHFQRSAFFVESFSHPFHSATLNGSLRKAGTVLRPTGLTTAYIAPPYSFLGWIELSLCFLSAVRHHLDSICSGSRHLMHLVEPFLNITRHSV